MCGGHTVETWPHFTSVLGSIEDNCCFSHLFFIISSPPIHFLFFILPLVLKVWPPHYNTTNSAFCNIFYYNKYPADGWGKTFKCWVVFTSLRIQQACVGLIEHVCPCINRIAHNELTAPLIPCCVGLNCGPTSLYWFEQVNDSRVSVRFFHMWDSVMQGMTQWGAYSFIPKSPPP